ncbi:hypothetical protein [Actinomadura rugatobispora]|uniref:MmcQ/YjbR family DNA-binding protein n=1 Tax=Actinomadura rugatobispora TaxID=1994 RepID=A0ABW1A9M8_9ACTN|nr:hypothetical protein GCM10010200_053710 [Actinomadura rugatobispora]
MSDAETVREIALGLPGAAEKVSWGMVTFRLSKGWQLAPKKAVAEFDAR